MEFFSCWVHFPLRPGIWPILAVWSGYFCVKWICFHPSRSFSIFNVPLTMGIFLSSLSLWENCLLSNKYFESLGPSLNFRKRWWARRNLFLKRSLNFQEAYWNTNKFLSLLKVCSGFWIFLWVAEKSFWENPWSLQHF